MSANRTSGPANFRLSRHPLTVEQAQKELPKFREADFWGVSPSSFQ